MSLLPFMCRDVQRQGLVDADSALGIRHVAGIKSFLQIVPFITEPFTVSASHSNCF